MRQETKIKTWKQWVKTSQNNSAEAGKFIIIWVIGIWFEHRVWIKSRASILYECTFVWT